MRVSFPRALPCLLLLAACGHQTPQPPTVPFEVRDADIASMQAGMASGSLTARRLTELYLQRITELNPRLHAILETNPDALAIADRLDDERRRGRVRGPLHGIPVVLKDTIETKDAMQTAAGSLTMLDIPVAGDAFVVGQLRRAGAVILGKANLTEWAGAGARLGWSSRGGQTLNPYAAGRSPLGSSAGPAAAVTASLAAVALGGETVGSIVGPSSVMGIVGVKTTAGLVSRRGTVPVIRDVDSIGPMARTVRDAAIVTAIAGKDDRDPQANAADDTLTRDFAARLTLDGLSGARLGVLRDASDRPAVRPLLERAAADLRALGATLVDIEAAPELREERFLSAFGTWFVTRYRESLAWYFTTRPNERLRDVRDIMAANRRLATAERPLDLLGQSIFEMMSPSSDSVAREREGQLRWLKTFESGQGLESIVARYQLDGVVALHDGAGPVEGPAPPVPNIIVLAALAGGAPLVSVPAGQVDGLPVALIFGATRWRDESLLRWAYAYEQRTRHRHPPPDSH